MKKYHSSSPTPDEPQGLRFVAKFYEEGKMNTSQAWRTWHLRPERPVHRRPFLFRCAAAAGLLILLGTGYGGWKYHRSARWTVVRTQAGERKEILLPDSSSVYLDENTTFRYRTAYYGEKQRNTELSGKAFFSVTPRPGTPFCLKTSLTHVRVLGTRFQVIAGPDSVSVAVMSGKVQCSSGKSGLMLTDGMSAYWKNEGAVPVVRQNKPNLFSWKTHLFHFENTPLHTVVRELETAYQIRITGMPHTEYRLNLSFSEKSVDEILAIINRTLDIQLKSEPK